jgi:hypothetical protein
MYWEQALYLVAARMLSQIYQSILTGRRASNLPKLTRTSSRVLLEEALKTIPI